MKFSSMFDRDVPPADGLKSAVRFILIFVLLGAGIVTAAIYYYRIYERDYRAEVDHQLSAIAELKAGELERYRKIRLEDGNIFFSNASFSTPVRRFFEQPADEDAHRELLNWMGKYLQRDDYNQVRLLDVQGVTRLSLPAAPEPSDPDTLRIAAAVLRSGQTTIEDFYWDKNDRDIYLSVVVPVFDESKVNRPPLGVLVLRIDPEKYLYPFIKSWPTPSSTAETLLVRREGNEAVFLNELRFQTNTALNLRMSLDRVDVPAVQAALGWEGIMNGTDYRGLPAVAAVRRVHDSPWSLVARKNFSEVYAPLRAQRWQTISMIGILLFGLGTTLGLVWRQQRVQVYQERAKSVESLRETNAYLENLINYANAPIIVWDPHFCITRFNHAFEFITGRSEAEVLGQPLEILFPSSSVENSMVLIRKTMSGERWETVEIPIGHRDGSIHTVLWNSATLYTADGKTSVATIAQGHDITLRKQAEAMLSSSEFRYRRLFETARDGILILDAETGIILDVNPFLIELLGYSHEVFLGKKIWELGFFKDIVANQDHFTELQQKEYIRYEDMALKASDGRRIEVEFTSIVHLVSSQKVIQCSIRDISVRKKAERNLNEIMDELRASNRDLEQFAYVASHDLQEPLRMVANYMQLVEQRYRDRLDQDARDFIAYAVDGAVRMQKLIDSLLEYSRLQSRKKPFDTVELMKVFERVLLDLEGRILETGAHITAGPLPAVRGDAVQLGQVFQNLVGNALKFKGESPPEIHIAAEEFPSQWKISVRDNGIGIEPEYQDKIFKIFQRLHSRSAYPGTGIGLAVCKRISERHGGKIGVESVFGKGSTFWFTIPKRENDYGGLQSN